MKIKYKTCLSKELTDEEWDYITDGFNESFGRNNSKENFIKYYTSSFLKNSFHVITYDDETNEFLGSTSVFPYKYLINNESILTGLSGGSFILPKARKNPLIYRETYLKLRSFCADNGIKFIIGIPNENLFLYSTKAMPFKYVFDLPYYVLPLKLSLLNKKLTLFNPIFKLFVNLYIQILQLTSIFYNGIEPDYRFKLELDDDFYNRRFYNNYAKYSGSDSIGYYKIYEEKEVKTAYIFDFRSNGKRDRVSLLKLIRHIISNNKVDVIAFVGTLNIKPLALIKLPINKAPKRLPFTIDIIQYEDSNSLKEFSNWDFSLMNFDAR